MATPAAEARSEEATNLNRVVWNSFNGLNWRLPVSFALLIEVGQEITKRRAWPEKVSSYF